MVPVLNGYFPTQCRRRFVAEPCALALWKYLDLLHPERIDIVNLEIEYCIDRFIDICIVELCMYFVRSCRQATEPAA